MKTYIVGEGLRQRTHEECLKEGLNPNPNPPGAIHLPTDRAVMLKHIKESQAFALKALREEPQS
jgi:hypothetical protein